MITDSARRRDGRSARTTNLRTIKSCITKLTQYTMFLKDFGEVRLSNFTDLPELNRFVYFTYMHNACTFSRFLGGIY